MERKESGEAGKRLQQQRQAAAARYRQAGFPAYADLVEQGRADQCSQMKAVQAKS
jgi:hypothetical protein